MRTFIAGSTIDSNIASMDTSAVDVNCFSGFARTSDGFIFYQNLAGSYSFGGITISFVEGSWDMILVIYSTHAPPPMIHPNNITTALSGINLYPNPATNEITIRNDDAQQLGTVRIFDALGKIVYQQDIGNPETKIDVENFIAGIYYIQSGQTTIKFVKK